MALSLDDIKYFRIVAQTLNITRASENAGISQPALSYAMKRLELEFGTELLVRLKNGIQLTKTGEEFLKRSKRLIEHWEDSQKILVGDNKEVAGEYSIGVHPSVGIYTLAEILPKISKQYPKLNFSLVHLLSREITQKVINWEVDFGIVINPVNHPDLVIKELGTDVVTLFKAKKSVNKIIYDPALNQSLAVLKKLQKKDFIFDGHIHSSNLEVITKLSSCGLGYGLLPERVAKQSDNLIRVKNAPTFKDRICLIYRKEKHSNQVSQQIIKLMGEKKL